MDKDAEQYDKYRQEKTQEAKNEIQEHEDQILKLVKINAGSQEVVYLLPDEIDPRDLSGMKGGSDKWAWIETQEAYKNIA
ncbi:hypothetical protein ACFQGE_10240 [Halomicroarcula sp. GCM10025817]|uniref:hypothetical protein n=1 Tax=Haloarcula TaxID=2237 RepID=UPI0023E896A0|nr:hypothetical protein [Halomicroarcula sp. SYNS111]